MQPYTAVDLLIVMRAQLNDEVHAHPDPTAWARSRPSLARMTVSWLRRALRPGRSLRSDAALAR